MVRRRSCIIWGLVVAGITQRAHATTTADYVAFAALAREDPEKALAVGHELYVRLKEAKGALPSLKQYQERMDVMHDLAGQVHASLRNDQRPATVVIAESLFTPRSLAPRPPDDPTQGSSVAVRFYQEYLPRVRSSLDATGLSEAELAFLRVYYLVEMREWIREIVAAGIQSAAVEVDEGALAECVVVLALLHGGEEQTLAEALSSLPPWARTPNRLDALTRFCLLRVGHIDGAWAIKKIQAGEAFDSLACWLRLAKAAETAEMAPVAVRCLRRAIAGLGLEQADRVWDLRFEIVRTYADSENTAMAAGEAAAILKELPKEKEALLARAALLRLQLLDEQGNQAGALAEAEQMLAQPYHKHKHAELLHAKWSLARKAGRGDVAVGALRRFLKTFPDHPLAAEMYYAIATDCLSAQRYDEARRILIVLRERFPHQRITRRANSLLERLDARKTDRATAQPDR